MPLFQNKPVPLTSPPPDLTYTEPVFVVECTGEVFRDYRDYVRRVLFYRSPVFSCSVSKQGGLTYDQALKSEEAQNKKLSEVPEEMLHELAKTVNMSFLSVDKIAATARKDICSKFSPGELVYALSGFSKCMLARVISAETSVAVEVKSNKESSGDGTKTEAGAGVETYYRVAFLTEREKVAQDKVAPLLLPGGGYDVVSPQEILASAVVKKSLLKRARMPPSVKMIKAAIRCMSSREPVKGAPLVLTQEYAMRFGLSTELTPELKIRMQMLGKRRRESVQKTIDELFGRPAPVNEKEKLKRQKLKEGQEKKTRRQSEIERRAAEREQKKQELKRNRAAAAEARQLQRKKERQARESQKAMDAFAQAAADPFNRSASLEAILERRKRLAGKEKAQRFPIEDQLVDRSKPPPSGAKRLAAAPDLCRDFSIPTALVADAIMVWDFLWMFGKCLRISSFALNDFLGAIAYSCENPKVRVPLLDVCLRKLVGSLFESTESSESEEEYESEPGMDFFSDSEPSDVTDFVEDSSGTLIQRRRSRRLKKDRPNFRGMDQPVSLDEESDYDNSSSDGEEDKDDQLVLTIPLVRRSDRARHLSEKREERDRVEGDAERRAAKERIKKRLSTQREKQRNRVRRALKEQRNKCVYPMSYPRWAKLLMQYAEEAQEAEEEAEDSQFRISDTAVALRSSEGTSLVEARKRMHSKLQEHDLLNQVKTLLNQEMGVPMAEPESGSEMEEEESEGDEKQEMPEGTPKKPFDANDMANEIATKGKEGEQNSGDQDVSSLGGKTEREPNLTPPEDKDNSQSVPTGSRTSMDQEFREDMARDSDGQNAKVDVTTPRFKTFGELSVEQKMLIFDFLINEVAGTPDIREYLEDSFEQIETLRRQKWELERESKQRLTELKALESKRRDTEGEEGQKRITRAEEKLKKSQEDLKTWEARLVVLEAEEVQQLEKEAADKLKAAASAVQTSSVSDKRRSTRVKEPSVPKVPPIRRRIVRAKEEVRSRESQIRRMERTLSDMREAIAQLDTRHQQDLEEEQERKESELERIKQDLQKTTVRTLQVGQDRDFNRYWYFPRSSAGLYVQSATTGEWGYYDSVQKFEDLLMYLDQRGMRELALKAKLSSSKGRLLPQLRKLEVASALKGQSRDAPPEKRRSTRIKRSRTAEVIVDSHLPWMSYENKLATRSSVHL